MSSMNINGSYYGSYPASGNGYASSSPASGSGYAISYPASGTEKLPGQPGMPGMEDPDKLKGMGEECQTCKNRKYQDGSDEANVSFKAAAHISPEAAGAAVRAHEQQHVSNAFKKAAQDNGKVLRASVSIHTDICPECGRSYVSGGTTTTQIKYYNEENPYQQDLKATDGVKYRGMNVDTTT